jgi:GNAT superfamily N-acetyltransferase
VLTIAGDWVCRGSSNFRIRSKLERAESRSRWANRCSVGLFSHIIHDWTRDSGSPGSSRHIQRFRTQNIKPLNRLGAIGSRWENPSFGNFCLKSLMLLTASSSARPTGSMPRGSARTVAYPEDLYRACHNNGWNYGLISESQLAVVMTLSCECPPQGAECIESPHVCWLSRLVTAPSHRGRGLGALAVRQAIKTLSPHGATIHCSTVSTVRGSSYLASLRAQKPS